MKTLAIKDGDLLLPSGSGYQTVSGVAKIEQDLFLATAEGYGSDPYHAAWGSLLDRLVGGWLDTAMISRVRAEVNRVLTNYIAVQQAQIQNDILQANKTRYGTNDVIGAVEDISVVRDPISPDRLRVAVTVTTLGGRTATLLMTVGG